MHQQQQPQNALKQIVLVVTGNAGGVMGLHDSQRGYNGQSPGTTATASGYSPNASGGGGRAMMNSSSWATSWSSGGAPLSPLDSACLTRATSEQQMGEQYSQSAGMCLYPPSVMSLESITPSLAVPTADSVMLTQSSQVTDLAALSNGGLARMVLASRFPQTLGSYDSEAQVTETSHDTLVTVTEFVTHSSSSQTTDFAALSDAGLARLVVRTQRQHTHTLASASSNALSTSGPTTGEVAAEAVAAAAAAASAALGSPAPSSRARVFELQPPAPYGSVVADTETPPGRGMAEVGSSVTGDRRALWGVSSSKVWRPPLLHHTCVRNTKGVTPSPDPVATRHCGLQESVNPYLLHGSTGQLAETGADGREGTWGWSWQHRLAAKLCCLALSRCAAS
ncbi:hypothetical protein V8C86DRAFT_2822799, partial [Haematococcus lacustris]